MNSKLRRTSSVVVVLILVLAGALVQPFGGNATAGPNGEGTLPGTWRGPGTPTNYQKGAPLPLPSLSSLDSYARGGPLSPGDDGAPVPPGRLAPGPRVSRHAPGPCLQDA